MTGRIRVSDICRNPENLVLQISAGFENLTYALENLAYTMIV